MMSKRFFILLAAGLASLVQARGQTAFKQELSIGGSFGMGVSTVSFQPKVQEKQLLGSHLGFTIRWITQKTFGLVAEVNLAQQGWSEAFPDPQYRYDRRLNYIDIPFLSHFYAGNKRIRFFVNAGPKIGFLLSESTSENVIASPPPQDATLPYQSEQWEMPVETTFAWGLCGGPGLELRTGIGIFQLEGRYYYSLGDIYGNRKADYFPRSSSQVFFAKLTYLIPIIK
jgi:hypothetical protein